MSKTLVLQFVKDCGLGNQLFEYAAGYSIARKLGIPLELSWLETSKRTFDLTHFGIPRPPFRADVPIVSHKLGQGNRAMMEISMKAVADSPHEAVRICHPFQDEQCFIDHADEIREIYKLEPFPLKVPEGKTPVAVQARRGDYVNHPRLNVTTPGYFLNGMDFVRQSVKHPHFFIVSDDPVWCRKEFGHLPDVTVMPPQPAIDGLRTMVACKAAIISNSTFGWWGAWLSGSDLVVVPERWHNGGNFYGNWKPAPDRWHRVPVTRKIETKLVASPPPPPVGFREYPRKYERAIVIPWQHKGDRWHSLRYCLRSIHANFQDKTCPILIYGTGRPPFLTYQRHRVIYEEVWTYQDALMRGVQIADEVVWMNDDICFLQPTGWDDLRRPLHYGEFSPETLADFAARSNQWRAGVLKAVNRLGPATLNYSTHTPYRFERDKAVECLREFGIEHKHPFELYYFNRYAVGPKLMNGERTMEPDFKDARFLNHTDHRLTPELKAAIAARFPDFAPWEGKIPFSP